MSSHTLVMASLKLGPRVKAFKEENDSNNLTLGRSLGDYITKVWPEIGRLGDIFAVAPFKKQGSSWHFSRPHCRSQHYGNSLHRCKSYFFRFGSVIQYFCYAPVVF